MLKMQGSQKVALRAGFRLFRQFKGSDRYTRKMRDYYDFRLGRGTSMSKHQRDFRLSRKITDWKPGPVSAVFPIF